jgi:hypothetical protein
LNDAGAATDSTRAPSRPGAFLAFFGEKSLESFSCSLAINTRDNLFSAAARAFTHWNSPILPSLPARFTFPVQLRSALLWIALPQQLWQPCDIDRDPPRLAARGRCSHGAIRLPWRQPTCSF